MTRNAFKCITENLKKELMDKAAIENTQGLMRKDLLLEID